MRIEAQSNEQEFYMTNLLKIGDKAPDFTLADKDQSKVSLKAINAAFKIVYFYPKDNTPGCTIQAKQFSKDLKKFKALDAEVMGISGGDAKSKTTFCAKNKLSVTLLSDTDFEVAKKYGVYGEKFFMGRKYLGISRVTYLIDQNNRIIKVYEKASPEENSSEIISDIEQLKGKPPSKKTEKKTSSPIKKAARNASSTRKVKLKVAAAKKKSLKKK